MKNDDALTSSTRSAPEAPAGLRPSGNDLERVRDWLTRMEKQGEDYISRGAVLATSAFDLLEHEAMLSGDLVVAVRDTAKRVLGGNCTFADDDVKLLAFLAERAIECGLHSGVVTHPRTLANIEAALKARRDSDQSGEAGQTAEQAGPEGRERGPKASPND